VTATHPPIDPELCAVLQELADELEGTVTPDRIPLLRERPGSVLSDDDLRRGGAIEIAEREIPGPEGAPGLPVLICRPAGRSGQLPGIYHMHGGGMVIGTNRTGLDPVLDWAEQLGAVIVSVQYRLAPEHPHPAPVQDCYAGLAWTAAHPGELGIDPDRLLVGGASAGGGLAAALALLARDRGGPDLAGQLLMCPMLDDRNETPSSHEPSVPGTWDRASNLTGWRALLGAAQGGPGVSPYAAPARAADLSGLPPAFLDVGSAEIFRDEVVDYAVRIWRAGGSAELHVWPGGCHGFDMVVPEAQLSLQARAARVGWLERLLDALADRAGRVRTTGHGVTSEHGQ
jgi:acetyl esterase/lipase